MLQQGPLWLELVAESFLLTSFDQPRIATSHFDGKLYAIQISFENCSRETLRGKNFRSCHKWRLELKKSITAGPSLEFGSGLGTLTSLSCALMCSFANFVSFQNFVNSAAEMLSF